MTLRQPLEAFRGHGAQWVADLGNGERMRLPLIGIPEGGDWRNQLIHDAYAVAQFRFSDPAGFDWRFAGSAMPFSGAAEYCQQLFGGYHLPTIAQATSVRGAGIDATPMARLLRIHYPELSAAQGFWTSDVPALEDGVLPTSMKLDDHAWMQAMGSREVAGLLIKRDGVATVFCRQESLK